MSDAPPPPPPPPAGGGWQQPAPGAGPQGPLASWGQRVIAYLLNVVILFGGFVVVAIVAAIFGAVADVLGALVGFVGYLALTAAGFYFYYLDGETGGHPGKRIMGLKTVKADTGELIGGGMGIVRALAHFVDQLICYIGFLFPLWDGKRQTIADKIVGTVVLAEQPKVAFGPELFTK